MRHPSRLVLLHTCAGHRPFNLQEISRRGSNFCILSSDPRSQTADLYGLGLIALDSELEYFNHAVFHIKELLKKKWDKPTILALKACSNMYKKLATDDWGQLAKDYAKSQLGWPKGCENEFITHRSLTEQNDEVFVLLLAK